MDQLRDALRSRHYSRRTEQAYTLWVRRFLRFHHMRHPRDMGEREINAFLTDLAVEKRVSSSTQTQALSAVLFLYRNVIGYDVGDLGGVVRARKPKRMPVVMTREEVRAVLAQMDGDTRLMASLMYGTGMRLMECLRLRVLDVDFGCLEITVRDGKGAKDRVTVLPEALVPALKRQLRRAKAVHERDLADGWGRVVLPDALDRKGLLFGVGIWVALAVLLAAVAVDSDGLAGLRGFALPIVLSLGISAWLAWRATRFSLVREASVTGGALSLTTARSDVILRPADVKRVAQLDKNPFGSGFYNTANVAWGAWLRIDGSSDGAATRRYLVWRPDSAAFIAELMHAGFPCEGQAVAVGGAS
jgi:hypothetical protein